MRGRFHHERQCIDALGASGNPSAKTGGFSHGRKRLCVITWAHLSVNVYLCGCVIMIMTMMGTTAAIGWCLGEAQPCILLYVIVRRQVGDWRV